MSKWWSFQWLQTHSIFLFTFCTSLGFVLCLPGCVVLSPFVRSIRTWAHHAAVAAAELGEWQRRGNMGLYCPFLWSTLVCTSMARTDAARVKNRFFSAWHHLSKMSFWICEMSHRNSGRGIVCRTQGDNNEGASCHCWRVRGAGQSLKADLSILSVYYRQNLQALLLSLLTLTTHVERVIMDIMESMSWGSIISQTDFTLHSVQLLWGKHDFSQKQGNNWKTEAKKPRIEKTLLMKD